MATEVAGTLTLRDIAKRFPNYRRHQLAYAIDQYAIEPRSRIGIIRLWAEEDVPAIEQALRRTAERAGGRL